MIDAVDISTTWWKKDRQHAWYHVEGNQRWLCRLHRTRWGTWCLSTNKLKL